MSRLDSFIRRMRAQRDILNSIMADVLSMEGPVIEMGLGNGRTYDHLRERLPGRRIVVFDRALTAFSASVPASEDLVLGEIRQTAPAYAGIGAALVHSDLATGYAEIDDDTISWLTGATIPLLRQGAYVASGLPLFHVALRSLPLPAGIRQNRYFLYRLEDSHR